MRFCADPKFLLAAVGLTIAMAGPARAQTVYAQAPRPLEAGGPASQRDGALDVRTIDNFTLGATTAISGLTWRGDYLGSEGTPTSFNLRFYSDSANAPGALLQEYSIPGAAGQTLAGNSSFGPVFDYSATLGSTFTAVAGMQYWLSIQVVAPAPPQWFWHFGTGGDNRSFYFPGANPLSEMRGDLTFSLQGQAEGQVVPEPTALAFAPCFAVLWFLKGRKRGIA